MQARDVIYLIEQVPAGGTNAFSMRPASATACCFGVPDDGGVLLTPVPVPVE